MDYYNKSLKLVKLMLFFVIFCVIYANFIQPNLNATMKQQQEQMMIQQVALSRIQKNNTQNNIGEDEFVKKSLEEFKNINPEISQNEEAKIADTLRAEYKKKFGDNQKPVEINYNPPQNMNYNPPQHINNNPLPPQGINYNPPQNYQN